MKRTNHDHRRARLLTLVLAVMLSLFGVVSAATGTAAAAADPAAKVAEKAAHAAEKAAHTSGSDVGVQDICNYTTQRPTIRRGSTGLAVKQAQCYVYYSVEAADLAIDGQFGPITDYWVRVFQSCAGITVDGIVGPQTWSHLTYWANSPYFVC
jgi:peptidoglycan hydrolase-like protein with peptidoglycan-binding domain